VKFHEALTKAEPEPCSGILPGERRVYLLEGLKELFLVFWRDADAGVFYADFDEIEISEFGVFC
jgi:hypothetical protein